LEPSPEGFFSITTTTTTTTTGSTPWPTLPFPQHHSQLVAPPLIGVNVYHDADGDADGDADADADGDAGGIMWPWPRLPFHVLPAIPSKHNTNSKLPHEAITMHSYAPHTDAATTFVFMLAPGGCDAAWEPHNMPSVLRLAAKLATRYHCQVRLLLMGTGIALGTWWGSMHASPHVVDIASGVELQRFCALPMHTLRQALATKILTSDCVVAAFQAINAMQPQWSSHCHALRLCVLWDGTSPVTTTVTNTIMETHPDLLAAFASWSPTDDSPYTALHSMREAATKMRAEWCRVLGIEDNDVDDDVDHVLAA
jgi:hypothetical protein